LPVESLDCFQPVHRYGRIHSDCLQGDRADCVTDELQRFETRLVRVSARTLPLKPDIFMADFVRCHRLQLGRVQELERWFGNQHDGAGVQRDGGLRKIDHLDLVPSGRSIWRVPVDGGAEVPIVDGLSYNLDFAVGARGLYFVALNDASDRPSVDFFDFSTRRRSTLVRLDKRFWFGMTLSPDERPLVFSLVDSAGSNLMLVDGFR
jgi:hypothetical protein